MTTLSGLDALSARRTGRVAEISISTSRLSHWSWIGYAGTKKTTIVNVIDPGFPHQSPISIVHWNEQGKEALRNNLWDKILVTPQKSDLGVVLSRRDLTVEVWSTFRDRIQTMTGKTITGSGNLIISDPFGLPLVYRPMQSRLYACEFPEQGDPVIEQVVTFTFLNLPASWYTASGSRVTVFWPPMDWNEPFKETIQYKSWIFTGHTGAEQRKTLRLYPRYNVSFRVLTLTDRQATALEQQLHRRQSKIWGVPWWPEKSFLQVDAVSGTNTLTLDTTYRPTFYVGGLVLIWKDAFHWEAGVITAKTDSQITLGANLVNPWPTGTRVVPMRKGYLGDIDIGHPTNYLSAATFTFECES